MADEAEATPDGTISEAADAFSGVLSASKEPKKAPEKPQKQATQSGPDDAEADEPEAPGPDDTSSDDADAEGSDNAPKIAPPKSMPEELRASFAKLPPDLQEFLVERERHAEKGGAKVANKASEERKAYEAKRTQYESELQRVAYAATQFRHPDIVSFEREFAAELKDPSLVDKLMAEDPLGRYLSYQRGREKAANGWNQQEALKAQFQTQQQETVNRFRETENDKLKDMVPNLREKAKWDAFEKDVGNYVVKHAERYGQSREEAVTMLKQGSAWALEMAWKAMKYDAAAQNLRDQTTKPGQNGTKLLKPGNAGQRNGSGERFNALVNRVAKTGRVEDAAGAFSALLGSKRN